MTRRGFQATLIAVSILGAPIPSWAEGRHPHYISARRDLRAAQLLLRVPGVPEFAKSLKLADSKLEAAVEWIDYSSFIDREDLDDHPRVDLGLPRRARLARVVELLRAAKAELIEERYDSFQITVLLYIDESLNALHLVLVDVGLEPRLED